MQLKSFFLVLAILLVSAGTSAQAAKPTIFGGYDCGQWIRKGKGHPMESWAVGYLSGLNWMHVAAGLKPNDPLDELNSVDQIYVWLDNYCKAAPLQRVDLGVVTLFEELKAKRSQVESSAKSDDDHTKN